MARDGEDRNELVELIDQLDDILGKPLVDTDDALELAIVAGLADRLGASAEVMAQAVAWRDGVGKELLDEMWQQVDVEPLVEALDGCIGQMEVEEAPAPAPPPREDDEEDDEAPEEGDPLENALFDIDDLVAAAVWCRKTKLVRSAARQVAELVRQVPDPFVALSPFAGEVARLPTVAQHLDLYDYWLAVADAKAAVGEGT
jgi:hypothetical protein